MKNSNLLSIFSKNNKIPIWFMRQAGRYLPEYKKVRSNFPEFIDMCLNSQAATEVTLQPLKRFELDAAILFSDILIVPHALGVKVRFVENKGPILEKITNSSQISKLTIEKTEHTFSKINETVKNLKKELKIQFKDKCLIGFAGSPWTVACYMVEGMGSRNFQSVKKNAYENEKFFIKLIDIITITTIKYLCGQIEAGADVVKLFDSWAGVLSEDQYVKWVIEPTKKIVTELKKIYPNVLIIGFPRNSGVKYIDYVKKTKIDVIAIDETIPINWIRENYDYLKIVQGNLDNVLLSFGNSKEISNSVKTIVKTLKSKPFIFNLGHGILPHTPIENVQNVIETVRSYE